MQTNTATRSSAKLVKLGIVGLGQRACCFAQAASKSDKVKIIAAYSRSERKRRSFQLNTRVPVVSDLKTLLSYPMIDGVILTTAPEQHLSTTVEAAKAKKHIFLEGPIAATLEQGLEIAALEEKYGVGVSIGCSLCFMPGVRKIREAIDAGTLGMVGLIEANFSLPRSLPASQADGHAGDTIGAGDPLLQLAVPQFEILQHLGGEIVEVCAMAAKLSIDLPEPYDQTTTLVKFADGKLGHVGLASTSTAVFSVRVFGSKAMMHYEADLSAWATPESLQERSMLYIQRGENGFGQREVLPLERSNMFLTQLELFAETCRTRKSGELGAPNANRALAVAHAAVRSLDNRNQSVRIADVLRLARSRLADLVRA